MSQSLEQRVNAALLNAAKAEEGWRRRSAMHYLETLLHCWSTNDHPGRPVLWLTRFTTRPWRCFRCGTWFIVRIDGQSGPYWHEIGSPDQPRLGPSIEDVLLSDD